MKCWLGPIFNAADDAVEQAFSKTSLVELIPCARRTLDNKSFRPLCLRAENLLQS
jgi:hypothetical protein